jgi:hypothetical protein
VHLRALTEAQQQTGALTEAQQQMRGCGDPS